MAIITFDPDELIEFMPEYGDNRSDDERCVVYLKFVPHSRIDEYRQMIRRKNKDNTNPARLGEVNISVQKKQFCNSVDRIKGYRDNKGKEITTPEEFYNTAPSELIEELIQAMEDSFTLDKGQAKNFKRVSDGIESEAPSTAAVAPSETEKTETVETDEDSPTERED